MTDTPTAPEERPVLPFAAFLQAHRQGASAEECSEALRDLVEAVEEHGKKGKLVIEIEVSPESSDAHVLGVSVAVMLKAPQSPAHRSIFYADADHNLTRDDPYRKKLPLAGPTGLAAPQAQEA